MEDKIEAAKQFMPFDALNGFRSILREKEKIKEERIELTDESKEEISDKLSQLREGDCIEVKFYRNEKYEKIKDKIKRIDYRNKEIKLNKETIRFFNIVELRII